MTVHVQGLNLSVKPFSGLLNYEKWKSLVKSDSAVIGVV